MFKEIFDFTFQASKKSWLWKFLLFISDWIIMVGIGFGLRWTFYNLLGFNEFLTTLIVIAGVIQYKTIEWSKSDGNE